MGRRPSHVAAAKPSRRPRFDGGSAPLTHLSGRSRRGGIGKGQPTVRDDRQAKEDVIPIELGAIRATDLAQIKAGSDDAGLVSYDPAFMNTAACKSKVSYIDGDRGILRY